MKCLYREKKYISGDYLDVYIYPAFKQARGRKKRAKPTSEVQAALNQKVAEDKFVRILNANFTGDDIEIHLTYNNDNLPDSEDDVKRDIGNYFRRVKRARAKLGLPELKYVYVIEGEPNGRRFHVHITMSGGVDRTELERLWGFGYANSRQLQFNSNGIEGIGRYVTKQYREKNAATDIQKAYKKRWCGSKNLIHPKPQERTGKLSRRKVEELATMDSASSAAFEKIYSGYRFSECRPFYNEFNGYYYLHVKMYSTGAKLANTKKRNKGGRSEHERR